MLVLYCFYSNTTERKMSQEDMRAAKAGYTHKVTFRSPHPDFAEVTNVFHTTPDAVGLWRQTLEKNVRLNKVISFEITELAC